MNDQTAAAMLATSAQTSWEMVQPSAITIIASEFGFRQNGNDKGHLRDLVQALRNVGSKLDPILLWREITGEGLITGRLILLDGEHRLAAYRSVREGSPEANRAVPAFVLSCDRTEALLRALSANAKAALPLTANERADGAWRLVRDSKANLSIARIAKASGASSRRVSYMRVRAKELTAAKATIAGEWWRDRQDTLRPSGGDELLTDTARKAEIIRLANAIREAAGPWPRRDTELLAEALSMAFGHPLRQMAEYLYATEDEFFGLHITTETGTEKTTPEEDF